MYSATNAGFAIFVTHKLHATFPPDAAMPNKNDPITNPNMHGLRKNAAIAAMKHTLRMMRSRKKFIVS